MRLLGLHHFTVRVQPSELPEVAAFWRDVVGLADGGRADFAFPGHWLYLGGDPVVHLAGTLDDAAPTGTGRLDHVALLASGLDAWRARLRGLGVPFREAPVPGRRLHQLFLRDPVGVQIELTFDLDGEPAG